MELSSVIAGMARCSCTTTAHIRTTLPEVFEGDFAFDVASASIDDKVMPNRSIARTSRRPLRAPCFSQGLRVSVPRRLFRRAATAAGPLAVKRQPAGLGMTAGSSPRSLGLRTVCVSS